MAPPAPESPARRAATAAMVAAGLAASALITVPIGAVPLTLQVFVVVLAALLLPPRWAALALAVYLLEGAIGLPVFSGMRGGLGVVAGPTGGYLIGFAAGAVAGSWIRARLAGSTGALTADIAAGTTVIAVVYALGWLQLVLVTGMGAWPGVLAGVVPFIVPDALKAAVAVAAARALRRVSPSGRAA